MERSVERLHPAGKQCARTGWQLAAALVYRLSLCLYVGTEYKHERPHDTLYRVFKGVV